MQQCTHNRGGHRCARTPKPGHDTCWQHTPGAIRARRVDQERRDNVSKALQSIEQRTRDQSDLQAQKSRQAPCVTFLQAKPGDVVRDRQGLPCKVLRVQRFGDLEVVLRWFSRGDWRGQGIMTADDFDHEGFRRSRAKPPGDLDD